MTEVDVQIVVQVEFFVATKWIIYSYLSLPSPLSPLLPLLLLSSSVPPLSQALLGQRLHPFRYDADEGCVVC